jgi:hypothetical protein
MADELHEKIRRPQIAAGEKVVCEYLEKSGLLKPRALADDDIPVSEAMIQSGARELEDGQGWHRGWLQNAPQVMTAIYRAMEQVRRAEADAEVIRRSVKDG